MSPAPDAEAPAPGPRTPPAVSSNTCGSTPHGRKSVWSCVWFCSYDHGVDGVGRRPLLTHSGDWLALRAPVASRSAGLYPSAAPPRGGRPAPTGPPPPNNRHHPLRGEKQSPAHSPPAWPAFPHSPDQDSGTTPQTPGGKRPEQPHAQPLPGVIRQPRQHPTPAAPSPRARSTTCAPVNSTSPTTNAWLLRVNRRERHKPIPLPRHLNGIVHKPDRSLRKPPPSGRNASATRSPPHARAASNDSGPLTTTSAMPGSPPRRRQPPRTNTPATTPLSASALKQQQGDPVAGPRPEIPLKEIRGLGHPIGEGGHGQFDPFPRGVVVEGHQGTAGIRGERGTQQVGRGAIDGVHPRKRTGAPAGANPAPG